MKSRKHENHGPDRLFGTTKYMDGDWHECYECGTLVPIPDATRGGAASS